MPSVPRLENLPDVLTVEQAAKVLRIGRTLAYELARRGEIPAKRLGHRVVIPKPALMRYLEMDKPSQAEGGDAVAGAVRKLRPADGSEAREGVPELREVGRQVAS